MSPVSIRLVKVLSLGAVGCTPGCAGGAGCCCCCPKILDQSVGIQADCSSVVEVDVLVVGCVVDAAADFLLAVISYTVKFFAFEEPTQLFTEYVMVLDSPPANVGKLNVTCQPSRDVYAGLKVISFMAGKLSGMVSENVKFSRSHALPPTLSSVVVSTDRFCPLVISRVMVTWQEVPAPISTVDVLVDLVDALLLPPPTEPPPLLLPPPPPPPPLPAVVNESVN